MTLATWVPVTSCNLVTGKTYRIRKILGGGKPKSFICRLTEHGWSDVGGIHTIFKKDDQSIEVNLNIIVRQHDSNT